MKEKFFTLLILFFTISSLSNATIHYVYPGGRGAMNGTSWGDAAPDIQYLLKPSNFPTTPGTAFRPFYPTDYDTIFVAGGTYNRVWFHNGGCIYQGTVVESSQFCRLHIYGGFNGYETSLDQRTDWLSNPSIIDGQGDRAVWFEDLIYHDSIFHAGNVVFDGFIVKGAGRRKEAFRIVNTNAWISHVIISDNTGIPFYLEHVPYYPNEDFYATTSLVDVIIKNNHGEGWPASLAVSAYSQLKIFNSTITGNRCDSMWNNHPLALYHSHVNKSICKIFNSIIWKNDYGNKIVDATLGQYPPGLYYQNSVVEHISDPTSDWNVYGIDLGNNIDSDPLLLSDCQLQYGSPAMYLGDYHLYPYYQTYLLYFYSIPFAFWFYDANNANRFGFDMATNTPLIDAGAIQFHKYSIREGVIIDWLNNTDIMGGNVINTHQYVPQTPPTDYVHSIPSISPTLISAGQPIYIENIEGEYKVTIFDANGRMISQTPLYGETSITTPEYNGIYIIVATQGHRILTKETIIVK